jgi:hypothetical protein
MVLMDTRYWTKKDCSPIGLPLKRAKLVSQQIADGKKLYFPPLSKLNSKHRPTPKENTLPAVIFPQWSYCPLCNKMYKNPWYDKESEQQIEDPCCTNNNCKGNTPLDQKYSPGGCHWAHNCCSTTEDEIL